jgi:hypothetical protein
VWHIGAEEKIFGELLDIYRDGVVYYSANKGCAGRIIGNFSSFLTGYRPLVVYRHGLPGAGALKKNCAVADATR